MNWDRFYGWYWLAWLLLGFGVPEGLALISRHPQRTLSEHVWSLEGTGPPSFVRYFVVAFLLWLLLHMGWRWFR